MVRAGSGQLDDVSDAIERLVINQLGGAEIVFHLVVGLGDDGIGDEFRADQRGEETASDDHEKKAEDELGAQR